MGDAVTVSRHPQWSNVNVSVYDNNSWVENRFMINVYIITYRAERFVCNGNVSFGHGQLVIWKGLLYYRQISLNLVAKDIMDI